MNQAGRGITMSAALVLLAGTAGAQGAKPLEMVGNRRPLHERPLPHSPT